MNYHSFSRLWLEHWDQLIKPELLNSSLTCWPLNSMEKNFWRSVTRVCQILWKCFATFLTTVSYQLQNQDFSSKLVNNTLKMNKIIFFENIFQVLKLFCQVIKLEYIVIRNLLVKATERVWRSLRTWLQEMLWETSSELQNIILHQNIQILLLETIATKLSVITKLIQI